MKNHTCTCPECKNTIDLVPYPEIKPGIIIECNVCGITLEVTAMQSDGSLVTEIVDEGK